MHNVHDDVICCKAWWSNLDFANTFLHFLWSQTTKFKDYQHFRLYGISPKPRNRLPAQQLIKCAHLLLHSNYSGSHLSNFSYPNLHLSEPRLFCCALNGKHSALYTNSSCFTYPNISVIWTLPVCSDKWLPTVCITIEWCRRTHYCTQVLRRHY